MEEKFIRMNIALADFSQGQQWRYNDAPDTVKMWLENKCILFETKICSLVTKNGESFGTTKTIAEINQDKMKEIQTQKPEQKEPDLIKPKNQKKPGRPKGSKNSRKVKPRKKIIQHDATTTIL